MIHGGDVLTYKHLYDGEIMDFSSNINPLGYPACLKEAIFSGLDEITRYPDIKYRRLRKNIGEYLGCSPDEVIVGNGAVEIIDGIVSMFNRVVVVVPCFMEYILRPGVLGKEVVKVGLNEDFSINEVALLDVVREGDLILLGNPNNPTGKRIDKDILIRIQKCAEERGAFLLLDEAFYEFCPLDYDSIELFSGSKNVCIIRAATKFFGLPGIRLGYAYADKSIVKSFDQRALPWSINAFADAASNCIFKDKDFIEKSKKYIDEQRRYVTSELKKIKTIRIFETSTNFMLIKLLKGNEDDIFEFMIKRGIMIRKASSFYGLDKSYVRIAIKDGERNKYLVECFKEY